MIEPTLNLTVQDRIRLHLGEFGQKNISVTIDEIASQMQLPKTSVYQGIHRLAEKGEVTLEKELMDNTRERIIGINLVKLEPSGRTYRKAADRSGKVIRIKSDQLETIDVSETPVFPNLVEYMQKRLAVENMKEQALAAGLDTSVIQFTQDEMAEEALVLMKLWTDLRTKYQTLQHDHEMQGFDLAAERRNTIALRQQLRAELNEDLIAMAGD